MENDLVNLQVAKASSAADINIIDISVAIR